MCIFDVLAFITQYATIVMAVVVLIEVLVYSILLDFKLIYGLRRSIGYSIFFAPFNFAIPAIAKFVYHDGGDPTRFATSWSTLIFAWGLLGFAALTVTAQLKTAFELVWLHKRDEKTRLEYFHEDQNGPRNSGK